MVRIYLLNFYMKSENHWLKPLMLHVFKGNPAI